jgi:hypothetical protein
VLPRPVEGSPVGLGKTVAMPSAGDQVLTHRALNRALLERQQLLRRARRPIADMVEHLLGLQAQAPMPPYYGLWSRLEGFDPHELGRMLTDREVVRLTLMRGTVHLVTVRDALLLRPLVQVVAERGHNGAFGRRMGGADRAQLAAAVRDLLAGGPLTARELGTRLVERGIGSDAEAIGNATRFRTDGLTILTNIDPRGVFPMVVVVTIDNRVIVFCKVKMRFLPSSRIIRLCNSSSARRAFAEFTTASATRITARNLPAEIINHCNKFWKRLKRT